MKLRIMSDLHLEFMDSLEDFVVPELPEDKDTVLILAGDIHLHKGLASVFDMFADRFKAIVFVYGNHEYYKANLPAVHGKVMAATSHLTNVHILDMDTVEIDGVHFVGSTLWTDMDNHDPFLMWDVRSKMSDYKCIRTGTDAEPWKFKLQPKHTVSLHIKHKKFMFDKITELKEAGETVVAVSHHLPSYRCVHGNYRGSSLNGAYASELWEDVEDSKPDLWVHGHTHQSNDFMLTDHTRLICNPRGYWPDDMNHVFNVMLQVEV